MAHTAANTLDPTRRLADDERYPTQSSVTTGSNHKHEAFTPARDSPQELLVDAVGVIEAFGRRLHDAGIPVSPSRSAQCARSLGLTIPTSRRQLYWTTRAVVVTDRRQLDTFDQVFSLMFGRVDASASTHRETVRT